jgi:hypothetical protein
MALARKLAWASLASAALLAVAAYACNATGVQLENSTGGDVNSHAPATWVLGSLGLVFLLHSLVLFAWANQQRWETRLRDESR